MSNALHLWFAPDPVPTVFRRLRERLGPRCAGMVDPRGFRLTWATLAVEGRVRAVEGGSAIYFRATSKGLLGAVALWVLAAQLGVTEQDREALPRLAHERSGATEPTVARSFAITPSDTEPLAWSLALLPRPYPRRDSGSVLPAPVRVFGPRGVIDSDA